MLFFHVLVFGVILFVEHTVQPVICDMNSFCHISLIKSNHHTCDSCKSKFICNLEPKPFVKCDAATICNLHVTCKCSQMAFVKCAPDLWVWRLIRHCTVVYNTVGKDFTALESYYSDTDFSLSLFVYLEPYLPQMCLDLMGQCSASLNDTTLHGGKSWATFSFFTRWP